MMFEKCLQDMKGVSVGQSGVGGGVGSWDRSERRQ
jgi:hypothetical protein